MIDLNTCIIDQIDNVDEFRPQEIADVIFKAKDHRMDSFPTDADSYKPLEGLSDAEKDYCLSNDSEIEQSLYEMSKADHIEEIINNSYKALEKAKTRIADKEKRKRK